MTKGVGPWLARSGHRGSKRAKNCSTSEPFLTMCAIWDWAEDWIFCRFWTKKNFAIGSGVGQRTGGPLWPLEVRSLFSTTFFKMQISE